MTLLSVTDLDSWYGNSQIVFDLDMNVGEGEVVGLLGRNGAGKTTTLRSIAGIEPPRTSGTVEFDGNDISGLPPHSIAKAGLQLIPEDRDIIPSLTVEENLELAGLNASNIDLDERLEFVYRFFPRVEERKHHDGNQLSGGEEQMVAIARSLISDPELLLLDEPTEGLAPMIIEDVLDLLGELKRNGQTMLIVEQNFEVVQHVSDRNYILRNGEIVYEGETEELREETAVQKKYLGVE